MYRTRIQGFFDCRAEDSATYPKAGFGQVMMR